MAPGPYVCARTSNPHQQHSRSPILVNSKRTSSRRDRSSSLLPSFSSPLFPLRTALQRHRPGIFFGWFCEKQDGERYAMVCLCLCRLMHARLDLTLNRLYFSCFTSTIAFFFRHTSLFPIRVMFCRQISLCVHRNCYMASQHMHINSSIVHVALVPFQRQSEIVAQKRR